MTRGLLDCLGEGSQVANITSQIGSMVVGARFDDLPYSTSKAVMNMVTVQLASQLRDKGISVVAFHPGWVRTDMGGPQADISTEESAGGILSTLEQLGPKDSGSFLCWDGSTHPW
jgi:NAD(P)-dependent dehydrogenase (short-subunit alcohol dehydrogenase family)